MDVLKYISVVLVFVGGGCAGGHHSHHDHVKVHVPEFIHHDHHTKIITIHHHHHKPKENHHHHHHHHHHKPHVPYGHHYHKDHKKFHIKTQTTTTGHGQGHKTGHGYHGHHGKYGHGHQSHIPKHLDAPALSYDPNPVTFEDSYKSFAPSVPVQTPQGPQVYGIQHTVKQVKVFDSLPGALPGNSGTHGYEVTEEGEQSDDDTFTSINSLSQSYPATFGFVHNAGISDNQNDVLVNFPVQNTFQASHDPFGSAPQPTSFTTGEAFSTGHADTFSALEANQEVSPSVVSQYTPDATGFDDPGNAYSGDVTGTALVSPEEALADDTPVSFSREAGIQEIVNTGDVETLVY